MRYAAGALIEVIIWLVILVMIARVFYWVIFRRLSEQ